MKRSLAFVGGLLLCAAVAFSQSIQNSSPGNNASFVAGKFISNYYSYSGTVVTGNAATGSSTIILRSGYVVLPDARSVVPFAVGVPIVISDAAPELITPTSVSGCTKQGGNVNQDQPFVTCTITAVFAAIHGGYAQVLSGTNGLAEAALDAFNWGGGVVVIAPGWRLGLNSACTGCFATQAAAMAGVLVYANVNFEDDQAGPPQYWNPNPTTLSAIATPTALTAQAACDATHTFCSDSTVAGTWTSGQVFGCIAYVDIMGNEGACSATANIGTTVVSKALDVGTPAASTGAVGYTIYLSLVGGTYAQAFQVPITSSICTLTKLETVTPACAVTNAVYGQVGSTFGVNSLFTGGAVVPALVVNTSPHFPGAVSTAASISSAVTAHTTFGYTPGSRMALAGVQNAYGPFAQVATQATTVPASLGAINLPAGFMNFIGKTIRICGKATMTQPGSTSERLSLFWDAAGTDTTTVPVVISDFNTTSTGTNAAWNFSFCSTLTTNSIGATGTIMANGTMIANLAAPTTAGELFIAPDIGVAASAGVNLTVPARIQVIATPVGATSTSTTLLALTLEVLN